MAEPLSELPPDRRGPSKLTALLSFSALVGAAIVVIVALVSLGRLLDRVI